MIYLTIYIVGYIASYYSLRAYVTKWGEFDWNWHDVRKNAFWSLFSWASVLAALLCFCTDIFINLPSKPPKWL